MSYDIRVKMPTTGPMTVGLWDPNRWSTSDGPVEGFAFGMDAEVWIESAYRQAATATVSMGAIGSHDTETANRRLAVYAQAIEIAELANRYFAEGKPVAEVRQQLRIDVPLRKVE